MVWQYYDTTAMRDVLMKYSSLNFHGIWIASAFKGAEDPLQQMPAYEARLNNHISWMKTLEGTGLNLRGIALTGWQR